MRDYEPDTLSYCIMTRPKAPEEALVFERYPDAEAFEQHRKTEVFHAKS